MPYAEPVTSKSTGSVDESRANMRRHLHHIAVFELRRREEHVEGLLVGRVDDVAISYADLVEHCRVKEPPRPVPGTPVGGGAADREPDRKVHDLLPVVETPVEDPLA